MTRKRDDFRIEDAVIRYTSGESVSAIAREFNVDRLTVRKRLAEAGVELRHRAPRKITIGDQEILERFASGENEFSMSHSLGIGRAFIRRRLLANEMTPRTGSESGLIRAARMTPQERCAQTEAAHDAVRGRVQPWSERCQRAKTRQERRLGVSPAEELLAIWLRERGISAIPQEAIGAYNADLGANPVAVEIFGGYWHGYGRHKKSSAERFRYILDQGWCVVIVWVNRQLFPLSSAAADYITSLTQLASGDPSLRGKYWVIRGDGKECAAAETDLDKITLIPSTR